MTYKQARDCVSKIQVAVPSILVLCYSSGKLNGLENINDVIDSATAYAYHNTRLQFNFTAVTNEITTSQFCISRGKISTEYTVHNCESIKKVSLVCILYDNLELRRKLVLNLPPFKSVATLQCKNEVFNDANLQHRYQNKDGAKSLSYVQ